MKNIRFEYGGTAYQQIDGVLMGSPFGPTLAGVFLRMIEKQMNDKIATSLFYEPHVDDILIFTDTGDFSSVLQSLNYIHSNQCFQGRGDI